MPLYCFYIVNLRFHGGDLDIMVVKTSRYLFSAVPIAIFWYPRYHLLVYGADHLMSTLAY